MGSVQEEVGSVWPPRARVCACVRGCMYAPATLAGRLPCHFHRSCRHPSIFPHYGHPAGVLPRHHRLILPKNPHAMPCACMDAKWLFPTLQMLNDNSLCRKKCWQAGRYKQAHAGRNAYRVEGVSVKCLLHPKPTPSGDHCQEVTVTATSYSVQQPLAGHPRRATHAGRRAHAISLASPRQSSRRCKIQASGARQRVPRPLMTLGWPSTPP